MTRPTMAARPAKISTASAMTTILRLRCRRTSAAGQHGRRLCGLRCSHCFRLHSPSSPYERRPFGARFAGHDTGHRFTKRTADRADVDGSDAGVRLDKLLAQRVEALSRARIQALIRAGSVAGPDGATIGDGSYRVKPGEKYSVLVPEAEPAQPVAEAIALNVVYEDRDVIVIDKPAHLVVHPAAGHASGTLVNALIAHCGDSLSGIGGVKRPGIVHRLDKGTSGLLVVAKTDAAHQGLSEQFAAHGSDGRMQRAYLALVWGKPLRPRGVI